MIIKHTKYSIMIFLLLAANTLATGKLRSNGNGYDFWNLKSISGILSLEASHRSGSYYLPGYLDDKRESNIFTGELLLNTSSFIYHPNFFQLNADFGFKPVRNLDLYITSPDNSEINTTEKVDISGIFFDERIVTLNPYFNFNHTFSRREYTTNLESFFTDYGLRLSSPNSTLPFSMKISQNKWDLKEIQTGRNFNSKQFAVITEFNKSFNDFNNNSLTIDYFNYERTYSLNSFWRNKTFNWAILNNFVFNRISNFNSRISHTNQTGNQPLNRLLISENVFSVLPSNFRIGANYNYNQLEQDQIYSKQHEADLRFDHNLFESLNSFILYRYTNISQTFYHEEINRGDLGFNYRKKIPTGILRLNYGFSLNNEKRRSNIGYKNIIDESQTFVQGTNLVLDNPFVDLSSIIVKDVNRLIIYQENFDYLVTRKGSFVEIQRIPGGQISAGATVLISYKAEQQPSLSFRTSIHKYGAGLNIINNLLEVYFIVTDQSYSNISATDQNFLKTLNQRLYGIKILYESMDVGAEYEQYKSNITPYNSLRYFVTFYNQVGDNLTANIGGNYRIYDLLDDKITQKFGDIFVVMLYLLSSKSRISFEWNYITQKGKNINLDLTSLKVEFLTSFRQLGISFGYENYNRRLINDKIRYSGIFAKVSRSF